MSKFTTKKVGDIKAIERVDELFIDDVGQLDLFQKSLSHTTFISEYDTLLRYIEHFANGFSVGKKIKYLSGFKDGITEFEFRSKHLRIYAIQQPDRKIVICGATKKKADSMDNISVFRLIKRKYLESLKPGK